MQTSVRKSMCSLTAAALILAISSCGGGGGGGSSGAPATLAGTWFGAGARAGGFVEVQVTVDSGNAVSSILIDGSPLGVTGTIEIVPGQSQIYSYQLSDGTEGGFYLDQAAGHAVLADWDMFAVLERGATAMPVYGQIDLGDSFDGISVTVDPFFELDTVVSSQATLWVSGAFDGSDSAGTVFSHAPGGNLILFDSHHGSWVGQYQSNGPLGFSTGTLWVLMSPDKEFAGSWACDSSGMFPEDCSFAAWRRN